MKNKHDTIPESSSEQEPNGVSFGLNELHSKPSFTLYGDWNKYLIVSNKRSPSNKRPPNLFSNKTR